MEGEARSPADFIVVADHAENLGVAASTPRWSTYDAFRFGVDIPERAAVSTQDRAYTSPISYTPKE